MRQNTQLSEKARWHPLKVAQVSTLEAITYHNFVAFRDLILDRKTPIGKGATERGDKLPILLDAMKFSARIVPHEILGEEVVKSTQISLVPNFFPHPISQQFVCCRRHVIPFQINAAAPTTIRR